MSYPFAFTRPSAETWLPRVLDSAPLVLLIAIHGGSLLTCHLPVVRDAHGALLGHLARVNPLASLADGHPIRIVALGPHAYVSPLDYDDPRGQVPTWNYAAAYVDGSLNWIDDADGAFAAVAAQTRAFEAAGGWSLADTPAHRSMLRGVRVFRIVTDNVDVAIKLSQNKSTSTVQALASRLADRGDSATAAWMRRALDVGREG